MKLPKRYRDVRIQVTRDPSPGLNEWSRIAKKGEVIDGWVDKKGNFRHKSRKDGRLRDITIYPEYFKVLGRFQFIDEERGPGLSPDWVLCQLAGTTFPTNGGAYDFMKKCIEAQKVR